MKVLLFGEYSGFHNNLKIGLQKLNVEVVVAGSPDGYKNLGVDINLFGSFCSNIASADFIIKQLTIYYKSLFLYDFDIVQIINPFLFISRYQRYSLWFNEMIYNRIIKNNTNCFLVSCGNDAVLVQVGKFLLEYNIIDQLAFEQLHIKRSQEALDWNLRLLANCKGVIPAGYSYGIGYETLIPNSDLLGPTIPPCINCEDFYFEPIRKENKLKIFHGVNQPQMKGSGLIIEAMNMIKRNYPNDVDLIIVKQLPYKEYVQSFGTCHVNIDQAFSYAYGLNALISMAMGKITLSGAEDVALKAIEVNDCPVINIKPTVDDIYLKLLNLLDQKNSLTDLSIKTRLFVEKYHDSQIIAAKYLDYWRKRI